MRYTDGHKEAARKRIVSAASKRLREKGLAPVAIADVMKAAGLTHGGFYFHFDSKNDLVRAALSNALHESNARNERLVQAEGLEALIRSYLSTFKRDNPGIACAAAALTAEVARKPVVVRRSFMKEVEKFIGLIGSRLTNGDDSTRRQTAIGIFAVMMGTLQLARAEPDPARSNAILDSGIQAALSLSNNQDDGVPS